MAIDDSYTKALLHMNGADASTVFTDEAGHTFTARGTAQLDTAQKKFGTASGLFDGDSDWIDTPDHDDWNLGSGSFTIDFRIRFNALPAASAEMYLCGQRDIPVNPPFLGSIWHLYIVNSAGTYQWGLRYYIYPTWTNVLTKNSPGLSTNTWYHIALVRSGNSWYVFQDGTQCGTTVTNSDTLPNVAPTYMGALFRIGQDGSVGYVNGWLDEFRLSKDIARWTANFTPPTGEYSPVVPFRNYYPSILAH